MKEMPQDTNHPFFYHVYTDTLPPKDAYLLNPVKKNQKTESMEAARLPTHKGRYYYGGWNNFTPFEKDFIRKVKEELKNNHGLDLNESKDYGPRVSNGIVINGT